MMPYFILYYGIIMISKVYKHVEGWHHRLNNVTYSHFYLFSRSIQNDYAYNSAILSRHLATGILPPRKKLFVNRNARLHNLEERFKHVGCLTSGFKYFPGGFAQAVDQTKHKVDQHTTHRALFHTSISFLK